MIPIRNIYYMLSYAFTVLKEDKYRMMATEEFANSADLLAAILAIGVSSQIKRGLHKEYIEQTEAMSSLRGKINLSESVKTRSILRRQMICSYDDFSVDEPMNRVIKATALRLMNSKIDPKRKKALRRLLVYFAGVSDIKLQHVDWNMKFDRNNQTYRMLIGICFLVYKGLLQREGEGALQMMGFEDEDFMHSLYEHFVLNYYKQEYPELKAEASTIDWQLDDDERAFLPSMLTDITLRKPACKAGDVEQVLIIDTKYYSKMTHEYYDKRTAKSANLYQVFAYVKNKDFSYGSRPHEVSGMLLYAKPDEEDDLNVTYRMSGNRISVRSLDLNQDFVEIKKQLDGIVQEYFLIKYN